MAVLTKLLGTSTEKAVDVVDTLNNALDTIKALLADVAALKNGTATPSPAPSPSPSPSPTPSGTVVFPTGTQSGTTGDTGYVAVGSANMRMRHPYKNAVTGGAYLFGLNADGDGLAFVQTNDNNYFLRAVTGFNFGNGQDTTGRLASGSPDTLTIPDGADFAIDLADGLVTFLIDGVQKSFVGSKNGKFEASSYIKGTGARYIKHAGANVIGLQIIAK